MMSDGVNTGNEVLQATHLMNVTVCIAIVRTHRISVWPWTLQIGETWTYQWAAFASRHLTYICKRENNENVLEFHVVWGSHHHLRVFVCVFFFGATREAFRVADHWSACNEIEFRMRPPKIKCMPIGIVPPFTFTKILWSQFVLKH